MQIESRLKRLEQAKASTRECTCADRMRILWPSVVNGATPDAGPKQCAKCGGVRQTVAVVYDK